MYKSCHYCRHRKKKCVLPPASASDRRCFACQHLNTTCEIGFRHPSLKRQRNSQQIADQVYSKSREEASASSSTRLGGVVVTVNDGDCQLPRTGPKNGTGKIIIAEDLGKEYEHMSIEGKYRTIVMREFPFIPEEYLRDTDEHIQPVLSHCINFAARLSLQSECAAFTNTDLRALSAFLDGQNMDLIQAASLTLLMPRIPLNRDMAEKAFVAIAASESLLNISIPIVAGCLTAHTWLSLVGYEFPPFSSPLSILLDYARELDQTTFAPHYLKLTHLAATLLSLRQVAHEGEMTSEIIKSWAKLEYSCLLNVAQMPSEYLDVRDEMPATPAAVVTHMLQSLIYLCLYHYMIIKQPSIATGLALRPIPGVLHFICATARSIFVCPRQVIDHWPLLGDVKATVAHIMLDFWDLTKFENCKALLNLWSPEDGRFEVLAEVVRQKIGRGPWAIEVIDGYSVFWTFRDLRSLSLEMYMHS